MVYKKIEIHEIVFSDRHGSDIRLFVFHAGTKRNNVPDARQPPEINTTAGLIYIF